MTTQVTLIVSLLDLLGGACKLTLMKNSVPADINLLLQHLQFIVL